MALTVSLAGDWLRSQGNQKSTEGTITFDSSYLTGGEVITAAMVGLGSLDDLTFQHGVTGFVYEWRRTNQTTGFIRVRRATPTHIPTLVVEEAVTISASDVGTLAFLPAYIVALEATAGATWVGRIVPQGVTPAAESSNIGQAAVNFTTGVITTAAADNVTSVRVTYFPQKEGTLFDRSNLVIDETQTLQDDASVGTTNRAALVQYVYNNPGPVVMVPANITDAPASGEFKLDIDSSGNTRIDVHADEDNEVHRITYIRHDGLADGGMMVHDDAVPLDLTGTTLSATERWNWGIDVISGRVPGAGCLMIPGTGTQWVIETADNNNHVGCWAGPSGTAAEDTQAVWNPYDNSMVLVDTGSDAAQLHGHFVGIPWINLDTPTGGGETDATAGAAEVTSASDLSSVVIRFRAIGR